MTKERKIWGCVPTLPSISYGTSRFHFFTCKTGIMFCLSLGTENPDSDRCKSKIKYVILVSRSPVVRWVPGLIYSVTKCHSEPKFFPSFCSSNLGVRTVLSGCPLLISGWLTVPDIPHRYQHAQHAQRKKKIVFKVLRKKKESLKKKTS